MLITLQLVRADIAEVCEENARKVRARILCSLTIHSIVIRRLQLQHLRELSVRRRSHVRRHRSSRHAHSVLRSSRFIRRFHSSRRDRSVVCRLRNRYIRQFRRSHRFSRCRRDHSVIHSSLIILRLNIRHHLKLIRIHLELGVRQSSSRLKLLLNRLEQLRKSLCRRERRRLALKWI